MADKRKLRLKRYNIDDDRYQELFYFCKGYQSRKDEINNLRGLTVTDADGMPKGNMMISQTESKAIRIDKLSRENELIENAAEQADPHICKYIIKNVTEGTSYEYLRVPCGRRQFYEKRRLFYKILSEKR